MTEPTKRPRGRQPGSVIVEPEDRKQPPISARLNRVRREKYLALGGTRWLEQAIDRAELPPAG